MSALRQTIELAKAHMLRKPTEPDEHALAVARSRGEHAKQLLADELLTEAFERVERVYMDAWKTSDALDIDRRERAWTAVGLLADVRNALITMVRDGDAATKKVKQLADYQSHR